MELQAVDHDPFEAPTEPVEHDPFAPQFVAVDHDPFAGAAGEAPAQPPQPGLLNRIGSGLMSYLRWNAMGSPGGTPGDIAAGMGNALVDAGRTITTPPLKPPADSYTDDSGRVLVMRNGQLTPWKDVDPDAAGAFEKDLMTRGNFAPDLAVRLLGGGTAFRAAPSGSLGMFAGPAARTADRGALDMAQQMHAAGHSPTQIWDTTGWFAGADGKWRFEIPDNAAQMTGEAGPTAMQTMTHPALYDAYPELAHAKVDANIHPSLFGAVRRDGSIALSPDAMSDPSVMLHEAQHMIQQKEGFAGGGNSASPEIQSAVRDAIAQHGFPPDMQQELARQAYHQLAGEVEARNVQQRADWSPSHRRAIVPWASEDVPRNQQIVRTLPTAGTQASMAAPLPADLPMDQAARLARAQAGDFRLDMPLYHGSNQSFDAFRTAPTTQAGLAAPGISTALDPTVANEFAGMRSATGEGQPQVYPLLHRAARPAVLDLAGGESHGEVVGALRDAFDAGHDAVMIRNYTTPAGQTGQKVIVVKDANQLRSPNAAFDPSKMHLNDLLASSAALALPTGMLADQMASGAGGQQGGRALPEAPAALRLVPVDHDPFTQYEPQRAVGDWGLISAAEFDSLLAAPRSAKINPKGWDDFIRDAPISENIEDRRGENPPQPYSHLNAKWTPQSIWQRYEFVPVPPELPRYIPVDHDPFAE